MARQRTCLRAAEREASRGARPGWRLLAAAMGLALIAQGGLGQTWTRLTNNPPAAVNMMVLLSDGSVMGFNNNGTTAIGRAIYRLTPNAAGSYADGTWTSLASMIDTRLYYSTQVLKDGRVFVAGGEYGTGGARAEIYHPLTNTWTSANPPITLLNPAQPSPVTGSGQQFYDSNSEILPDGKVLISPVMPKVSGQPLIYDPATNTWAAGPNYYRGVYQNEATWAKLPDDTILTIDPFGTNSERYDPVTNRWINDGIVPVSLYDPYGFELGGAAMLANGKCLFLGSTGQTALYTPTGTTAPGTWAAGPVIPSTRGVPDGPCAMMIDGKVLCMASAVPTAASHFPSPSYFYEYDPTVGATGAFTPINGPTGVSDAIPTYKAIMLCLPNGQILYSHMGIDLYCYTPGGSPLALGRPVITGISRNGDGSFHLTGTGLNGISEGASYGDDAQMNSNYPIVRIDHSNGNVYYARTYDWSSTSIMTAARVLSTEYRLPASMPEGAYSVVAVANGNASDPATGAGVGADPAPQSVCRGAPASFSVTPSGVGPFTYQWRRGTSVLTNSGNISGADAATLTINPALPGDIASDYHCVVANALGSAASAPAALTLTGCCPADLDDGSGAGVADGGVGIDDLLYFLTQYEGGLVAADLDDGSGTGTRDGSVEVSDLLYFVAHYEGGC